MKTLIVTCSAVGIIFLLLDYYPVVRRRLLRKKLEAKRFSCVDDKSCPVAHSSSVPENHQD